VGLSLFPPPELALKSAKLCQVLEIGLPSPQQQQQSIQSPTPIFERILTERFVLPNLPLMFSPPTSKDNRLHLAKQTSYSLLSDRWNDSENLSMLANSSSFDGVYRLAFVANNTSLIHATEQNALFANKLTNFTDLANSVCAQIGTLPEMGYCDAALLHSYNSNGFACGSRQTGTLHLWDVEKSEATASLSYKDYSSVDMLSDDADAASGGFIWAVNREVNASSSLFAISIDSKLNNNNNKGGVNGGGNIWFYDTRAEIPFRSKSTQLADCGKVNGATFVDGSTIVTSHKTGEKPSETTFRFWDIRNMSSSISVVKEFACKGYYHGLQSSSDGSLLFALGNDYDEHVVVDGENYNNKKNVCNGNHGSNNDGNGDDDGEHSTAAAASVPISNNLISTSMGEKMVVSKGVFKPATDVDTNVVLSSNGKFLIEASNTEMYLSRIDKNTISNSNSNSNSNSPPLPKPKKKKRRLSEPEPQSSTQFETKFFANLAVSKQSIESGHEFDMTAICFSDDDTLIATGDSFGNIYCHFS